MNQLRPRHGWRYFFLDNWQILAIAAAVILLVLGLIYLITYRKTETVFINSRYWTWSASVKYDVTTTRWECDTVQSCTGIGEDRTCTTKQECGPVTHTTIHTRCSNRSSSTEYPPYRPPLCAMQRGDYIRESLVYHITYRVAESDKTDSATFDGARWDELQPGAVVEITTNAMRRGVKIEQGKKVEQ